MKETEIKRYANQVGSWLACLVCFCFTSCGDDGPRRYNISGNVTYDGKPVPFGNISFDPVDKGFGGGYSHIEKGRFETSSFGRGHLGGPHHIHITGFSGVADPRNPDSPAVPMFQPYEFDAKLPEKVTSMDFEVPLSLAPKKPGSKASAK